MKEDSRIEIRKIAIGQVIALVPDKGIFRGMKSITLNELLKHDAAFPLESMNLYEELMMYCRRYNLSPRIVANYSNKMTAARMVQENGLVSCVSTFSGVDRDRYTGVLAIPIEPVMDRWLFLTYLKQTEKRKEITLFCQLVEACGNIGRGE